MEHLLDRRVLFFGGKGGVGKTTCAAATALEAARRGRSVLLVSVDPAHSVSDVFAMPVGDGPTAIVPGLTARELDPAAEVDRYLATVKSQVSALFSPSVVKQAFRQFDLATQSPGLEDVAVFDRIVQLVLEPSAGHDLLIVDTAPTGHALRMLAMPEVLSDWLDALARRRRDIVAEQDRAADDAATDPVVVSLTQRRARVQAFHQRLTSTDATGFALVLTPERLPIEETKRAADALDRLGVGVPAVIVNRVLPTTADGDFLAARARQQAIYLREIEARFGAYRRIAVPQFEADVYGLDALERVRAELFRAGSTT